MPLVSDHMQFGGGGSRFGEIGAELRVSRHAARTQLDWTADMNAGLTCGQASRCSRSRRKPKPQPLPPFPAPGRHTLAQDPLQVDLLQEGEDRQLGAALVLVQLRQHAAALRARGC